MAIKHNRRLPIVRNDKMVGIVTARELASYLKREQQKRIYRKEGG